MSEPTKRVRITQIGSPIGRKPGQKETLIGLGLHRMHASREVAATPETQGRIRKVAHLLKVEELA
ncbi:MAG: 50S ribosomal protein L30 [Acidiphilium sp.]